MRNKFPGGVWPVMLTPFTENNTIDYPALKELVDWYIQAGVDGLFAVCQSSEMFFLSLEERCALASAVVAYANGRVPVICSGHVSDAMEDQMIELNLLAKTGADALILITNRLAKEGESDETWKQNCNKLLEALPEEIPLGFYECPYPYKRVLSPELLSWCAQTNRFYFLKDTCCDAALIRAKLRAIEGSKLRLYNANTTTLLDSLRNGAAGYSGVMANFHPELYVWLCKHYDTTKVEALQDWLTIASLIERQWYPVNAKYHLRALRGLSLTSKCRTKDAALLTDTFCEEVRMMERQAKYQYNALKQEGIL